MRKALCVGINHFLRPGNDLNGCVPDARQMAGEVMPRLQVEAQNVTLLTDAQATKLNVMQHLNALVEEAKAGKLSYLALTWSGHGTHYPRPEEADGLGEALCCYDIAELGDDWDPRTIVKDAEFKTLLNQAPTTCTVEAWLDTCYSSGMDRAIIPGRRDRFLHNPGNSEGLTRIANSTIREGLNSNIVLWCACSEAQESADAYIAGGAHGAFTYFWCREFAKAPTTSRVNRLVATRRGLAHNDYEQFPRLKAWNVKAQAKTGM